MLSSISNGGELNSCECIKPPVLLKRLAFGRLQILTTIWLQIFRAIEKEKKMGSCRWHAALKSLMVGLAITGMLWGCSYLDNIVQPESKQPSAQSAGTDQPSKDGETPKSHDFVHKVQWPGENLSLIAKWYTGSSANWGALAKANPKLDPNLIRIGDKIVIPPRLMKNAQRMPHSFVSTSSPKEGQNSSPAPKESEPKEILYAPI